MPRPKTHQQKSGSSKGGGEDHVPQWQHGNGWRWEPRFDPWDALCQKYNEVNHWKKRKTNHEPERDR